MAKKVELFIDEHLARFAEIYFGSPQLWISDRSIVWDFAQYMGGNHMVEGNHLYQHPQTAITVIFDTDYYYLLDRDWQTQIKSCLKHLFWHKMFLSIKKAKANGQPKNEGIRKFVYDFELDDLDIETESFRRAMTRYADSELIKNEILLGRITDNFKRSKALPPTPQAKLKNQLNIF